MARGADHARRNRTRTLLTLIEWEAWRGEIKGEGSGGPTAYG